jgi:hypothetical protein
MTTRLGVTVREAGWLLSLDEAHVRRLLGRGHLRYAVTPSHLSPESVRALLPDDQLRPLREAALDALLHGRLEVPAPATRYAAPAPITELASYLTTNHDTHHRSERSIPAPK